MPRSTVNEIGPSFGMAFRSTLFRQTCTLRVRTDFSAPRIMNLELYEVQQQMELSPIWFLPCH